MIKLTNLELEGHARAHNTQQNPICVTAFYVTPAKMQAVLGLMYGLFFL